MFSDMERLASRRQAKPAPEVVVRTLSDIQAVLKEFDPAVNHDGPNVSMTTTLVGEDEHDAKHTYKLTSSTVSKSRRSIILEGMQMLKRHSDTATAISNSQIQPVLVNGKQMPVVRARSSSAGVSYVDQLIKRMMGGSRDGLKICWDLGDGYIYKYCIFEHKLTRSEKNGTAAVS